MMTRWLKPYDDDKLGPGVDASLVALGVVLEVGGHAVEDAS